MSTHSITISMDNTTIEQLQSQGYALCAFKAVQSSNQGQPLLWISSNQFTVETTLNWQDGYIAYTSNSEIMDGSLIAASSTYHINLGQSLQLTNYGSGNVTMGQPGQITIQNNTHTPSTCGLGQATGQSSNALVCASSVYPNSVMAFAPVNKVLLMFSTNSINAGTVVGEALANGTLLDLSNNNSATVSYNLNQGWFNPSVPAQAVSGGDALAPLLIEPMY